MIARVLLGASLLAANVDAQLSRAEFEAFEQSLERHVPPVQTGVVRDGEGRIRAESLEAVLPDGRAIPVFVLPPPSFEPSRRWPMLLVMHGGPSRDEASSLRAALQILGAWRRAAGAAGWIVVSPAMTHVVVRAPRTEDRLPYEILRPDQMEAILRVVGSRYPIDSNRIVSTGISLGSNFSIGFAASRPDRFSAIVPVSTEGESREHLLRNLMHVPTFVLEGAQDPNIRGIEGPRAMKRILDGFGYDAVYLEFPNRAHEGFQEYYSNVLEWIAERPRDPYPTEVVRVPHGGIMPLARRVHWIEPDTRRGLVRARVTSRHRIDLEARWARTVRVFLNDRFVDLDAPIEIWVHGERAYDGKVQRSIDFARGDVSARNDSGSVYAASVDVPIPTTSATLERARAFSESLRPRHPAGPLSFWEMYAARSIEDRLPSLGIEGEEASIDLDGELSAIRIEHVSRDSPFRQAGLREGDLLLEVDGEPFFEGSSLQELRQWLVRELDTRARVLEVRVQRGGTELTLRTTLSLTPF